MGVARGDPPSREHKATHNSSTIEDKNPGKKNGGGWVHARKLHTSCAGRWHGREAKKNTTNYQERFPFLKYFRNDFFWKREKFLIMFCLFFRKYIHNKK